MRHAEESRGRGDQNLYHVIRALVEPYGGFDLDIPERALPPRKPPEVNGHGHVDDPQSR
jgi:hypothetical protein